MFTWGRSADRRLDEAAQSPAPAASDPRKRSSVHGVSPCVYNLTIFQPPGEAGRKKMTSALRGGAPQLQAAPLDAEHRTGHHARASPLVPVSVRTATDSRPSTRPAGCARRWCEISHTAGIEELLQSSAREPASTESVSGAVSAVACDSSGMASQHPMRFVRVVPATP